MTNQRKRDDDAILVDIIGCHMEHLGAGLLQHSQEHMDNNTPDGTGDDE
jgi:hypothetical protein